MCLSITLVNKESYLILSYIYIYLSLYVYVCLLVSGKGGGSYFRRTSECMCWGRTMIASIKLHACECMFISLHFVRVCCMNMRTAVLDVKRLELTSFLVGFTLCKYPYYYYYYFIIYLFYVYTG